MSRETPKQRDPVRTCIDLGECRPRHASRKDTKRWCRGRAGTPHQWEWRADPLKSATERGERGFYREEEWCRVCGREKDRYTYWTGKNRARCHCGELMQKTQVVLSESGEPYVIRRDAYRCDQCGYQPSCYLLRVRGGREVLARPRVKCQCEITDEKAEKRQKYTSLYAPARTPETPA